MGLLPLLGILGAFAIFKKIKPNSIRKLTGRNTDSLNIQYRPNHEYPFAFKQRPISNGQPPT